MALGHHETQGDSDRHAVAQRLQFAHRQRGVVPQAHGVARRVGGIGLSRARVEEQASVGRTQRAELLAEQARQHIRPRAHHRTAADPVAKGRGGGVERLLSEHTGERLQRRHLFTGTGFDCFGCGVGQVDLRVGTQPAHHVSRPERGGIDVVVRRPRFRFTGHQPGMAGSDGRLRGQARPHRGTSNHNHNGSSANPRAVSILDGKRGRWFMAHQGRHGRGTGGRRRRWRWGRRRRGHAGRDRRRSTRGVGRWVSAAQRPPIRNATMPSSSDGGWYQASPTSRPSISPPAAQRHPQHQRRPPGRATAHQHTEQPHDAASTIQASQRQWQVHRRLPQPLLARTQCEILSRHAVPEREVDQHEPQHDQQQREPRQQQPGQQRAAVYPAVNQRGRLRRCPEGVRSSKNVDILTSSRGHSGRPAIFSARVATASSGAATIRARTD